LREHYPVIVVGAGPTGLTLANLLGTYGVQVLLVERNSATVSEPRAVSIDDESLRTMQAAGVVDVVLGSMVRGYGSEYYGRSGHMFLRVDPTEQPYGYPRRNAFRQPLLEAQLRQALHRFPHVTTAFSSTLRGFQESASRVRVQLDGAVTASVDCDYLIGCDGAGSAIRTALGIKLQGRSFDEAWLILDLDNAAAPSRNTYVFCDPERACIALPGPNDTRRLEIKLHPHETAEQMLRPEVVSDFLTRFGATPGSTLTRKVVYRFHARVAERWSSQRVFLAGDAAHLSPPFAGQGMNSGIRDAHNLAWKLAFVVSHRLGPQLLQTYEAERRDHVQQMIQLALRMGRIMAPANPLSGWLAQTGLRLLGAWPQVRDYFGQMKYKPQPRFSRGFLLTEQLQRRRSLVGRLLPQPRVTRSNGEQVLLDEVLGPQLSLLCQATDLEAFASFARERVWRQHGVRLVAVGAAGARAQIMGDLEIVVDQTGGLVRSLVPYRGHALLLRPDHYVAATFSLTEAQAAVDQFESLMAATWPQAAPVRH